MILDYNSVMIANISKSVKMNAPKIRDCEINLQSFESDMPSLIKQNDDLELEQYQRRWNLKLQVLKENDKDIRKEVIGILAKNAQ